MGIKIMISSLGSMILMLWICKKRYSFLHFPYNQSLSEKLSNQANLNTRNNLRSFCYGYCNNDFLIDIHDINALDSQEKLFIPSFSLKSKFICEMRQTWILVIIFIPFVIGTIIMLPTVWDAILMLWICEKSFAFQHFPHN